MNAVCRIILLLIAAIAIPSCKHMSAESPSDTPKAALPATLGGHSARHR